MKIKAINKYTTAPICMLCILLPATTQAIIAKSDPSELKERQLAFKRAKSLDNGISISWLEQTWSKDILKEDIITKNDIDLLKTLGFRSIRVPVAFNFLETQHISPEDVLKRLDKIVQLCRVRGLKVVIDYHYGNLNDQNYATETARIINTWLILTKRYQKVSADDLLFELYNEPPHMNPGTWKDAAYNIVTAIRKIDKKRTLIVGASNFNSIYELSRMVRLADENIIYTFHFYEPFLFTHQGAEWVGAQVATTGVPFPYTAENFPKLDPKTKGTWGETNYYQYRNDGNIPSLTHKIMIVKKWADKYGIPIICGEYGVYNKHADEASRCRYIKAMRKTLQTLNIPGMLWDYNGTFSLFNGEPSLQNLSPCMRDAIGYTGKN